MQSAAYLQTLSTLSTLYVWVYRMLYITEDTIAWKCIKNQSKIISDISESNLTYKQYSSRNINLYGFPSYHPIYSVKGWRKHSALTIIFLYQLLVSLTEEARFLHAGCRTPVTVYPCLLTVIKVLLSVWSEVQTFAYGPANASQNPSFKSRLVLPFWYRLTQAVLEKRPSNWCSSST